MSRMVFGATLYFFASCGGEQQEGSETRALDGHSVPRDGARARPQGPEVAFVAGERGEAARRVTCPASRRLETPLGLALGLSA